MGSCGLMWAHVGSCGPCDYRSAGLTLLWYYESCLRTGGLVSGMIFVWGLTTVNNDPHCCQYM